MAENLGSILVVFRCAEQRFQGEWATVMVEELGQHYVITGFGGARSFLEPTGRNYLFRQLEELRRIVGPEGLERARFVAVAHDQCKAYEAEKDPRRVQDIHLRQLARWFERQDFFGPDLKLSLKRLLLNQDQPPFLIDVPVYGHL